MGGEGSDTTGAESAREPHMKTRSTHTRFYCAGQKIRIEGGDQCKEEGSTGVKVLCCGLDPTMKKGGQKNVPLTKRDSPD